MSARVLVIDDSSTLLGLVQQYLETAGYRVKTLVNPMLTAMELGKFRPDLVLLDVNMPGVGGTQVLDALRKNGCSREAALVLFSGIPEQELADRARAHGAAGYIHKGSPFDGARLVRQVRKFLVNMPERATVGEALVVDDSRAMRRLLGEILEEAGLRVSEATNGEEALETLSSQQAVNVVLLDLNMPIMDGFTFMRRVRKDPRLRSVPVLMVTSESHPERREEALREGVSEFLTKPFDREAVLEKLRSLGILAA